MKRISVKKEWAAIAFLWLLGPLIIFLVGLYNRNRDRRGRYITREQGRIYSKRSLEIKEFMARAEPKQEDQIGLAQDLHTAASNLRKEAGVLDKTADTLNPPGAFDEKEN